MSGASMNKQVVMSDYQVWDRTTRWFHWINVLAVIGLIAVGTVILNAKALGVSGEHINPVKRASLPLSFLCGGLRRAWSPYGSLYCWAA